MSYYWIARINLLFRPEIKELSASKKRMGFVFTALTWITYTYFRKVIALWSQMVLQLKYSQQIEFIAPNYVDICGMTKWHLAHLSKDAVFCYCVRKASPHTCHGTSDKSICLFSGFVFLKDAKLCVSVTEHHSYLSSQSRWTQGAAQMSGSIVFQVFLNYGGHGLPFTSPSSK